MREEPPIASATTLLRLTANTRSQGYVARTADRKGVIEIPPRPMRAGSLEQS